MEDLDCYTSSWGLGGGGMMLNWFPNLVETQVDLIATTITSLFTTSLTKPITFAAPTAAAPNPRKLDHHTAAPTRYAKELAVAMVKRVGQGVVGAVYAGMVLSLVMVVSAVVGILLVNCWVEKPVFVREKLWFDYTEVNPEGLVVFNGGGSGGGVNHDFRVSISLLVPDSDYNRDVGVFQIVAEVISTNGKVIARSSQPSMLRFQSHPIRLMRTLAMGLPLVLGLTRETQKITVDVLNYKETNHLRTEAIKITLMPRAGTSYLPQLYEAEILVQSKLPRLKELVYNWKWTFYVWTSSYIYILLLLLLVYFFKPLLVYPVSRAPVVGDHSRETLEIEDKNESRLPEEREFTESLRKWQQYRKKRKAELLSTSKKDDIDPDVNDGGAMSASSYTVTKDDIAPIIDEDVGDSESVCKGAYKYEVESS